MLDELSAGNPSFQLQWRFPGKSYRMRWRFARNPVIFEGNLLRHLFIAHDNSPGHPVSTDGALPRNRIILDGCWPEHPIAPDRGSA